MWSPELQYDNQHVNGSMDAVRNGLVFSPETKDLKHSDVFKDFLKTENHI